MSANDIDDEESISVSSSEIASSSKQQKTPGRPFNPVWEHFNQIEKKKNGHYSAGCKYCSDKWQRANMATFKFHIARKCSNAPMEAQLFYFKELTKDNENQKISSKRQDYLENGMCRAFACAGVSFNVAGNEIFRAWLQDLRPGFDIPSPKTLAGRIFNKQLVQVETKIEKELQHENNITLHLYALHNYSDSRHTAEFLAQEIETIINQIGKEKFCAVVSDSAHRLNLICKDIMKESFAKRILSQATLVTQFFRSCHIANAALEKEIQINNIIGGGIKRYVATRWSSYYDTLYSILHLKVAFIRVKSIIQLESRDSILADCFIHLIKLASTIYRMPQDQNITFRKYCITSINRQLSQFNDDIYRLTYFLHPKFR
ncbi:13946_t:CDS:2, partial [Gigaspora margarita]